MFPLLTLFRTAFGRRCFCGWNYCLYGEPFSLVNSFLRLICSQLSHLLRTRFKRAKLHSQQLCGLNPMMPRGECRSFDTLHITSGIHGKVPLVV